MNKQLFFKDEKRYNFKFTGLRSCSPPMWAASGNPNPVQPRIGARGGTRVSVHDSYCGHPSSAGSSYQSEGSSTGDESHHELPDWNWCSGLRWEWSTHQAPQAKCTKTPRGRRSCDKSTPGGDAFFFKRVASNIARRKEEKKKDAERR